jgi:hypothetical protein
MSTAVLARTARREHRCTDCRRRIRVGHRYLRHILFPGHDANSSTRPLVLKECMACSADRDGHTPLLVANACSSYCHGTNPCARPFKHTGDCECQDCPERVQ